MNCVFLKQKHYTNTATGELTEDVSEGVKEVKTKLDSIIDFIETLRS